MTHVHDSAPLSECCSRKRVIPNKNNDEVIYFFILSLPVLSRQAQIDSNLQYCGKIDVASAQVED